VLVKVREIVDQLGGEPRRLKETIRRSFSKVERRYARLHIDRFTGSQRPDLLSLKTAWRASARDVYRSGKTPAILRQMLRLAASRIYSAKPGDGPPPKTALPDCEDA
jgi:hypothetical protein